MDKAKAAINDFMHKAGHHDTTVHERVAPAVTEHTVTPVRHEEATTALDREVHQDHYHTSVQPIADREVLPEQHHHNMMPVEHKEHHHGSDKDVQARLEREAARFRDTSHTKEVKQTSSVAPAMAGEHIHHHVHEVIQPVVQKETIQPSVVHTTVPIQEVHLNQANLHATSALPAVSMADFKQQGGVLSGREERVDGFEGEPRSVSGTGSTKASSGLTGSHHHTTGHTGTSDYNTTGRTGTSDYNNTTGRTGASDYDNTTGRTGASDYNNTTGHTGNSDYNNTTGRTGTSRYPDSTTQTGTSGYSSTTGKKPTLGEKLNPKIDANGDGKAGFMS